MAQFEAEWSDIKINSSYPFVHQVDGIPNDVILDATFCCTPQRVYLEQLICMGDSIDVIFSIGSAHYTAGNIVVPVEDVGFIQIGTGMIRYLGRMETIVVNAEVLSSNIFITEIQQSVDRTNWRDGYNLALEVSGQEVNFVVGYGNGLGPYCGESLIPDAVYTINGISPTDDGTWSAEDRGFFIIDTDTAKLLFSLGVDPNRLDCIRPGYTGPAGPQGPMGVMGANGKDALPVVIEFEECYNSQV